ncbi:uncharacterized protein LOC134209153 [Armigeres subalbatus]|uniref:uncharacterized protein LOC134209153 n=1 Tax=Armigeres subalbatus TaxID=124917 RepID=UPI002ED4D23F
MNEDAPAESFFFWKHGGSQFGCHTGIIETRVGNMRKDVLPEKRLFRRTMTTKCTEVPEQIKDLALGISAVSPTPHNARHICETMRQCFPLHNWLLETLKENKMQEILRTFPLLVAYNGLLVQQTFDQLKPNRHQDKELEQFLRTGIILDKYNWNNVQDPYVKGLLRIFKSLTNRGIKRKAEEQLMQPDEEIALPLIRWIKCNEGDTDVEALRKHATRDLLPHIVCIAERFQHGPYYIQCHGYVIPCSDSACQAVDVFFKMFDVFGIPVPVLLRNVHSLICFRIFKSVQNACSQTVQNLAKRLEEIDVFKE